MKRPISLIPVLVVFLAVAAFGQTRPEAPVPPSVTATFTSSTGGGYVGAERCQSCHKAETQQFNLTHHAALKPAKADGVTGCEMCHGPGKAHSEGEEAAQGDDAKTAAANKLIPRQSQTERRALLGLPPKQPRSKRFRPYQPHPARSRLR